MPQGERIEALDFIRGIAVLGILLANIVAFSHNPLAYYWPPALPGGATEADSWIWLAQYVLVDGKMRGLFTILFGAGLVLFTERRPSVRRGIPLQAGRLFLLGLFGIAHYVLLFSGDILFMYAAAGFVALLFLNMEARMMLVTGILWALGAAFLFATNFGLLALLEADAIANGASADYSPITQYWQERLAENAAEAHVYAEGSYLRVVALRLAEAGAEGERILTLIFYETIPLMLIGMGLFKASVFTDPGLRRRWRTAAIACVAGSSAGLLAAGLYVLWQGFPPWQTQFVFFSLSLFLNLPWLLGAMVLLTDAAAWLRESWLGDRLQWAGRMAFSNYIGTSLVMMLVFQGWAGGLYGELHRAELLLVVLLGWAMMLTFSRIWLAKYRYGPLEWAWRCLTYRQLFPLRSRK